jgi:hypothetical protein
VLAPELWVWSSVANRTIQHQGSFSWLLREELRPVWRRLQGISVSGSRAHTPG